EDISKKLILILTEIFTIDYRNLEMQQQIQRFLEEYFKNLKGSNKEISESNKPSVLNGNGTTTPKEKGISQEKDKTESLDYYEDDTKPVMMAIHKPDKENIQPVGMQSVKRKNTMNKRPTDNLQSNNNRFNIKENLSNYTGHTEPNEKSMMDLLCNIMNRLEIIESNQKGAPSEGNKCTQSKNNHTVQNIEVNMATHNINRLKIHGYRLDILIQWSKESNLNLISISETNIQEIEGKYLLKEEVDYRGIWTNTSISKHKGSRVGLLVQKDLEKHIGKIKKPN
ncbi:26126_t:CDS:2, partial [Gigaspora margarita]